MEDLPGRRNGRMGAELGLLQVKRVVCVHRLVMALHKRRGLRVGGERAGVLGWLSKGCLRMFKMLGPMSWSITRSKVGAFKVL